MYITRLAKHLFEVCCHTDEETAVHSLVASLKKSNKKAPRVTVYCRTLNMCADLYVHFHFELVDSYHTIHQGCKGGLTSKEVAKSQPDFGQDDKMQMTDAESESQIERCEEDDVEEGDAGEFEDGSHEEGDAGEFEDGSHEEGNDGEFEDGSHEEGIDGEFEDGSPEERDAGEFEDGSHEEGIDEMNDYWLQSKQLYFLQLLLTYFKVHLKEYSSTSSVIDGQ